VAAFGRVAIVGVGLLGGSVGLALKQRGLADTVAGVGRRESSLAAARRAGAVDSTTLDLAAGVRDADLIVFATPVSRIRQLIPAAAPSLHAGQVATDVGSSKQTIVQAAEAALEGGASFVGAHPMAGSEKRSVQFARPDLFEGALCFVTPTPRTPPYATERVTELWRALGGRVRLIDPATHDRTVAAVSHAPHVVASALVNGLDKAALGAAGPGFADLTRIASSDPDLWAEICAENAQQIADALSCTAEQLTALAHALRQGNVDALRTHFQQAKQKRDSLAPCTGK